MKEEEPGQTGKSEKCWRFFARLQLLAVTLGLVGAEVDGWSPGRVNSGAVASTI